MACKPKVVEALALRKMMYIYLELGLDHVNFEGDYMVVVKATNSPRDCWTELRSILHDIKLLMQQNSRWKVSFVYKKSNMVAHYLVVLAKYIICDRAILDTSSNYVTFIQIIYEKSGSHYFFIVRSSFYKKIV